MGNDIGDVNNDGLLDILVLDMLPSDEIVLKSSAGEDSYEIYKMKLDFGYNKQFTRNTLQLNLGNNNFAEIAQLTGIHATDWSFQLRMVFLCLELGREYICVNTETMVVQEKL